MNHPIRLYDTMARKKREFVPVDPSRITMYVCGPTVYGRAHIGNARPAVVFDTLARLIRHHYGENSLTYARNVTDVDDKIIAAAAEESIEPAVISERFERFYLADMGALGVRAPDLAPHATAEIVPMVAMIEKLIARGNAYVAEGHVLFSVKSDPEYGALSRRDREAMLAGARVEVAPYKRDAADFVLWKPSDAGVIGWESPWGRGRPGWHIECSAMIAAHLGETIDIHGGGLDLIFPHHENEIAQSRCAHRKPLANYWVHNGFVDMGAEKMSKSLGNVVLINRLLEEGRRGEVLRLALISAHYRSPLPWTSNLLDQSRSRLDRWYKAKSITTWRDKNALPSKFLMALGDDLNSPRAITIIEELATEALELRKEGKTKGGVEGKKLLLRAARAAREMRECASLIGLLDIPSRYWTEGWRLPTCWNRNRRKVMKDRTVAFLVLERTAAKARRDFVEADRIRAELAAEGVLLEDGPSGTTWRRA